MRSIRRELLAGLLASVLVAATIAAAAVYHRAQGEAGDLLDYQLRQMALSLRDQTFRGGLAGQDYGSDFDFAIDIRGDDGSRVHYSRSRVELPQTRYRGYSNVDTGAGTWRMYTLQQPGFTVRVAQPMSLRDRLAVNAALRTMTPFLLLVPLLAILVWFAVTRGLKPLDSVAAAVKARSASAMTPLDEERVPSEIKPVVSSLNDLLARLTRSLEVQRAFVADAAHALRTPLTALQLQIQLAERASDAQEREAAFATLKEGVTRASHMVEQLLTLARSEPQATDRPQVDVDLGALTREVVASYTQLADAKKIDLGVTGNEMSAVVRGDHEALRTLLANLVDNAVRYTPAGGRVDVAVVKSGEGAAIEVTDTGPGIPLADRERVFDRFYRVPSNDVPGSGLGLAIVRSIAERHRMTVTLEDGPEGRGLRVHVAFPRA
jgi:two-component system OmpR family sensor kinase